MGELQQTSSGSTNVKFTLPKFSKVLQQAIEKKTLLTYRIKFVFECTLHLKSLVERPEKSDYNKFCKMIVDQYPEFKDDNKPARYWVDINSNETCFVTVIC